jgi:ABC-type transporter Mla MlaB component
MKSDNFLHISYDKDQLTCDDARDLASTLIDTAEIGAYCLNCHLITECSTAALALLIRLRINLIKRGGELFLTGLRDRMRNLYEVHRMECLLPQA